MSELFPTENLESQSKGIDTSYENRSLFDSRVQPSETFHSERQDVEPSFNPDERVGEATDMGYTPPNGGLITDFDSRIDVNGPPFTQEDKIKLQDKTLLDLIKQPLDQLAKDVKGKLGEMRVDQDMREKGYKRISVDMIYDLKENLKKGIDGVYYKPDGKPPYVIIDAKFNTSQLNPDTADGKQMSKEWIEKRLDDAVGKDKADDIRAEALTNPPNIGAYVAHVDTEGKVSYDKLDDKAEVVEKDCKLS